MPVQRINDYLQHALKEDFTSPNPEVRKAAIYALGRLGSGPEVLLVLKNIAAEDLDPEVRYTAKKALSYWEGVLQEEDASRPAEAIRVEIRGPDGQLDPARLAAALASTVPAEQITAIVEAVKLGSPSALGPITKLTREEQDPWVLAMGVKALGSLGGLENIPEVAHFLKHQNHRVVANAIEALEMLGDEALPDRLVPFLENPDNRIRANAAKALYPKNPNLAFETLARMAQDHRPWMRSSAVFVLKVLDDPRCEELLREMVAAEFAPDLTRQLLEALTAQATAPTVGFLALMVESAEGERSRLAKTALDLAAKRLGMGPAEIAAHAEKARTHRHAAAGQRSGMFTIDPKDLEGPAAAPAPPRGGRASAPVPLPSRAIGYKELDPEAHPEAGDPGVRLALAGALGLAVLALAFAWMRVSTAPPTVRPGPAVLSETSTLPPP